MNTHPKVQQESLSVANKTNGKKLDVVLSGEGIVYTLEEASENSVFGCRIRNHLISKEKAASMLPDPLMLNS